MDFGELSSWTNFDIQTSVTQLRLTIATPNPSAVVIGSDLSLIHPHL